MIEEWYFTGVRNKSIPLSHRVLRFIIIHSSRYIYEETRGEDIREIILSRVVPALFLERWIFDMHRDAEAIEI